MVSVCFVAATATITATDASFEYDSMTTMPDAVITYSVPAQTETYTIYPVTHTIECCIIERPEHPDYWKWIQEYHSRRAKLRSAHRHPTHWRRTRAQLCLVRQISPALQLIFVFIIVIL